MWDRAAISSLTGQLSFVIWLFAQSPQLYTNYRRGSVDGLSPVFLTQWMLGDATNLLGCVLTQQLPFQIAVATYFCCVDVCIMAQYVYYWSQARTQRGRDRKGKRARSSSLTNPYSVLSETSELLRPGRSGSRRRNLSLSQSQTLHRPHLRTTATTNAGRPRSKPPQHPPMSRSGSTTGDAANYRALSEAALSVAQLAQEAARRREVMLLHHSVEGEDYFSHRRSRRSKSRASASPFASQPPSRSRSRVNSNDPIHPGIDMPGSEEEAEGRNRAGRTSSTNARRKRAGGSIDFVHTALSPTRESRDRDQATSDEEAHAMADSVTSLASESTQSSGASIGPRGRDMVRTANKMVSGDATPMQKDGTCSSSSSDGTARMASPDCTERMAMSHHQLGRSSHEHVTDDETNRHLEISKRTFQRSLSSKSHSSQRLTTSQILTVSKKKQRRGTKSPASARRSIGMVLLGIMMISSLPLSASSLPTNPSLSSNLTMALLENPWNRLIGRISAWLCALLYITSRIPQIWENHIRRSVAGLSILLFIAAFSGNLLYTISVLVNEQAVGDERRAYLQESLPFLLGSGGTLIFDLIIVAQWLAWHHESR